MKVTVFLVVVMMMCLVAVPAMAKDASNGLSASVGILSSTEGSDLSMGQSLSLSYDLPTQIKACRLQAAVSFIRFSGDVEGVSMSEKLTPITIRGIKDFETRNASLRPYAGIGLGIMQMSVSASDGDESESLSNTTYCYELIAGANFGKATFAELKVLGSPDSDVGIGLNIGYRF
ncbi:MAG: hypothetical protein M1324_01315 [Patescibacteria group bacterium]|nr:hypothetical protein [Patescibacteria group bacterium]